LLDVRGPEPAASATIPIATPSIATKFPRSAARHAFATERFNNTRRNKHRLMKRPDRDAGVLQRPEHEKGRIA
jgi:hypothetical protein